MGQWSHSPLPSSSCSSCRAGTPSTFRRFICPKQELRFDIDALRNLLLLVEVFNILQETGKGPAFEGEQLHQDLCVMGIRRTCPSLEGSVAIASASLKIFLSRVSSELPARFPSRLFSAVDTNSAPGCTSIKQVPSLIWRAVRSLPGKRSQAGQAPRLLASSLSTLPLDYTG